MIVEDRVANLEAALARFIEQSNLIVAAIHEDVAEMRAHSARTDRKLLEMQQQEEKTRDEFNERWVEMRQQGEKTRDEFNERWAEMRQQADKDRQQAEKERKDFNRRLAELSDSMGTLIEDMVAPCSFNLARAIFATEEAQTSAIRVKRKHPTNPGEMMELDLLAEGPAKVLVVEVKRRMDTGKAVEYRQKLARLPEFFPELAGKAICSAVASVYLEPAVIVFLNREKIYGIAMGDEVMEVVNLGQF